jgi:hypothetical protein
MGINVEETKVIRISRHTSPPQIIIDKKNSRRVWNNPTSWIE